MKTSLRRRFAAAVFALAAAGSAFGIVASAPAESVNPEPSADVVAKPLVEVKVKADPNGKAGIKLVEGVGWRWR